MKFFFDNTLPPRLARSIHELVYEDGDCVEHLQARFERDAKDTLWLAQIADEGNWVVLTHDLHLYTRPIERKLWEQSTLVVGYLAAAWSRQRFTNIASRLLAKWDDIKRVAGSCDPGTCFRIPIVGAPHR